MNTEKFHSLKLAAEKCINAPPTLRQWPLYDELCEIGIGHFRAEFISEATPEVVLSLIEGFEQNSKTVRVLKHMGEKAVIQLQQEVSDREDTISTLLMALESFVEGVKRLPFSAEVELVKEINEATALLSKTAPHPSAEPYNGE